MIHLLAAFASSGGGPIFNLAGAFINHDTSGGTATAAIRLNVDGTVDRGLGGSFAQVSADTDWVIPNDHSTGNLYVRYTNVIGSTPSEAGSFTAGEDNWSELTASATLTVQDTSSAPTGTKDVTFDMEIATDSGGTNVVASANYRLRADYDSS